jgi:hypothetical protein
LGFRVEGLAVKFTISFIGNSGRVSGHCSHTSVEIGKTTGIAE